MNELAQLQVNEYQIEVMGESPVVIQRRPQGPYGSKEPDKWAVMRLDDSMSKEGE